MSIRQDFDLIKALIYLDKSDFASIAQAKRRHPLSRSLITYIASIFDL
ncbi:MAG: hypothetical protein GDA48_09765 [Hormoscilla sp. GM102CHS1]|nr:hypothetical protein [Hormoscilla sp. GM102CHS1]